MFPKNKQNNLRQTKKNEIKEERYLNYATILKYGFCFLIFYFPTDIAKYSTRYLWELTGKK